MKIVIGNKKYSSWWLALKITGQPFEEVVIPLDVDDTAENIRRYSPSGRVPALVDGNVTIWDSLAICEYLNEKFPGAGLWPQSPARRAHARSITAEMHSGFMNLRNDCSMRIVEERPKATLRPETQAEVERIGQIWEEFLAISGGPFLFGEKPCIADCFYAPVVSRFRTYQIPAAGRAGGYLETIWAWPLLQEWVDGARKETLRLKRYEG
jgi:glutathione S-transferase